MTFTRRLVLGIAVAACATAAAVSAAPSFGGGTTAKHPSRLARSDAPLGSADNPLQIGVGRISLFMNAYQLPEILAKQGIHVNLVEMPATPQRIQAMLQGNLDATFAGWVDTIRLASQGAPLMVLSDVARKGAGIVSASDSGITSPAGWVGKKVAVSFGSMQWMVAIYEMVRLHIPTTRVNFLQVGFADMPTALCKHDIDSFVGTEPYNALAVTSGCGRELPSYVPQVPWRGLNANMIATKSFVQKNPGLSKKLVAAMTLATRQANANMAQTKATAVSEFGVPQNAVNLVFSNVQYTTNLDWKLIQAFINAEYRVKFITTKPAIKSFVSTKFAKIVDVPKKKVLKKKHK